MRILLTGASGFVASNFLRKRGGEHDVTVLGRSMPDPGSLGPVAPSVDHVACDFGDPASLVEALRLLSARPAFDAVVHLAVSRLHRTFPQTALDLFDVNLGATARLLDFAYRSGAGHFVLGSTGSVYDVPYGELTDESRFLPPKSYFAATKQAADALAVQYRPHFPVAVLRFFVPYGPGLDDRMLSSLAASIRDGRPLTVPSAKPPLVFSPIYVDDAVTVLDTALRQKWNDTVDVASGEEVSIVDAGRMMAERIGRQLAIRHAADAGSFYLVPRLERLKALMPGHSFVPFSAGLDAMLLGRPVPS